MEKGNNIQELNTREREHLKKRITASIFKYQRYRRNVKYAIGLTSAAVVASFVFGVYFNNLQTPSIETYVETSNIHVDTSTDKVTLMLEEGKSVDIEGDNSSLAYSSTGEKISIGKNDELSQANKRNNKVVYNTLIVPYGKRSQIKLSDGTQVWLNSGSKLVYPVTFSEKKREVYLEGEGIFDVAHNEQQPFMVLSKNHEIEVLGTLFNVSNYSDDDSISTTLKNGSVQIKYKTDSFFKVHEVLKISPGTRAVYGKNSTAMYANKVDVEKYFSWRDGVFIFKNDNLKHIMKRLSRYYNVDISVNDKQLEAQTFSGYLDLKENVENVVKIIKETSDFEYTINDNQILIN
ncbi:FecR family protein [Flagellimonas sp. 2504JD4-2]